VKVAPFESRGLERVYFHSNGAPCAGGVVLSSYDRITALEAEGHELISRGHARLAEAAKLRADAAPPPANRQSWIPAAESPLGKRKTLALHRARAVESTKVGRSVLIRRASLEQYLNEHRHDGAEARDDEDLFAARRAS
jgi:hypothetical protein